MAAELVGDPQSGRMDRPGRRRAPGRLRLGPRLMDADAGPAADSRRGRPRPAGDLLADSAAPAASFRRPSVQARPPESAAVWPCRAAPTPWLCWSWRSGPAWTVVAIHVDHGLRPGSAAEADGGGRRGRPLRRRLRVSNGRRSPPGPDLEARARRARYGALPAGRADRPHHGRPGRDRAAGHAAGRRPRRPGRHAADRRGPVGMRTTAGRGRRTGRAGLCSACGAPRRPPCARPRASCPVVDPSNGDPRFRRNRVRAEVLPLLSEVAGRDLVPVLARQAALLADDAGLLEALSAGHRPHRRPRPGARRPGPWPAGRSAAGCGRRRRSPTPSATPVGRRGGPGAGGRRRARSGPASCRGPPGRAATPGGCRRARRGR